MPQNYLKNTFPIIMYTGDATHLSLYKALWHIKFFSNGEQLCLGLGGT